MTNHQDRPSHSQTNRGSISTNGLGLAGFVLSLIGLCSGGALSPIGLIVSFIAIFRRPRGLAIAGLVLGILGSTWLVVALTVVGVTVIAAMLAGLIAGQGALEATVDGWRIRDAIVAAQDDTGALPASVEGLSLDADTLQDRWGRPYRITIDADASLIRIESDGPDGETGTDDDVSVEINLPTDQD